MWLLEVNLNGNYRRSKWQTHEGAIADRERQLQPRRIKDPESITGFRTEWPLGWTAIRKERSYG